MRRGASNTRSTYQTRVFRLACPPGYASGGTGNRLPTGAPSGGGPSRYEESSRGGSRGGRGGVVSGNDGGSRGGEGRGHSHGHHPHPGRVVKDITKNASKATKGLFGMVGHAVQRTAEMLSQQEMTIGVYNVHIVKEMAEGGERIDQFFILSLSFCLVVRPLFFTILADRVCSLKALRRSICIENEHSCLPDL